MVDLPDPSELSEELPDPSELVDEDLPDPAQLVDEADPNLVQPPEPKPEEEPGFLGSVYNAVAGGVGAVAEGAKQTYESIRDHGLIDTADAALDVSADAISDGLHSLAGEAPEYWQTHKPNADVQRVLEALPAGTRGVVSTGAGLYQTWDNPHQGALMKTLTTASTLEQGIAREVIDKLSMFDAMPREEAIKMLSQEELHMHDLLEYAWRPTGATARVARGLIGFGMDVFFDPLGALGVGGKIAGGKSVMIGGRRVTDLAQISKAELAQYRLGKDIEKIVSPEIAPWFAGHPEEIELAQSVVNTISDYQSGVATGVQKLDFHDLMDSLSGHISNEAKEKITAAQMYRQKNPGFLRSLAEGETSVTFTMRVPGTDIGTSFDVPLINKLPDWVPLLPGEKSVVPLTADFLYRWQTKAYKNLDAFDTKLLTMGDRFENEMLSGAAQLGSDMYDGGKQIIKKIGEGVDWFITESNRPLFNSTARQFHGDVHVKRTQYKELQERWFKKFYDPKTGKMDEPRLQQVTDLVETMPWETDEVLLKKFGKSAYDDGGQMFPGGMSKEDFDSTAEEFLHGTDRPFDQFEQGAKSNLWNNKTGGFFFTKNEEVAHRFANYNRGGQDRLDNSMLGQGGHTPDGIYDIPGFDEWGKRAKEGEDLFTRETFSDYADWNQANGMNVFKIDENDVMTPYKKGMHLDPDRHSLKVFRKGHEPRIIKTKVYGKTLDLTDPGQFDPDLVAQLAKGNQWERGLAEMVHRYKDDVDNYRYQMQANYQMIPNSKAIKDYAAKHGYGKIKMADAYESGFESIYVPDAKMIAHNADPAQQTAEITRLVPSAEKEILRQSRMKAAEMRMSMDEDQLKMADEMMALLKERSDAYEARGIPYTPLNPFSKDPEAARGYMKHMISQEFLGQHATYEKGLEAAARAIDHIIPNVDKSALGRSMRKAISDANRQYAQAIAKRIESGEKLKVTKLFVDNPIEATMARLREMDDILRSHDAFAGVMDLAIFRERGSPRPGAGYVRVNPDDWGNIIRDRDGRIIQSFSQFVPKRMREAWTTGRGEVYLPEDVATRLQYMVAPSLGATRLSENAQFRRAVQVFNYMFRNTTLSGTGYIGQQYTSNAATYMYAGGNLAKIPDAMRVLYSKKGDELIKIGRGVDEISMTRDEMRELLMSHGMMKSSLLSDVPWDRYVENLATARSKRNEFTRRSGKVFDLVNLYALNRKFVEFADDTSKTAFYLSKLDEGYTFDGAREATELWFANYDVRAPGQKLLSNIIPFTATGLKTMEQTVELARRGKFSHLSLPAKVHDVFDGAYVETEDARNAATSLLPPYAKHLILGPLMPGARALALEAPWVINTVNFAFNPDVNYHPAINIIQMGATALTNDQMDPEMDEVTWKRIRNNAVESVMPPLMRNALAMHQIRTGEDIFGMNMADRHTPSTAWMAREDDDHPLYQKWENAVQFGEWAQKTMGKNAIMDFFFFGGPRGDAPVAEENINDKIRNKTMTAAYGNFFRSHIRNLTFGLVKATPLDNQFMLQYQAMNRRARKVKQYDEELAARQGLRIAPGRLLDPAVRERIMREGTGEQQKYAAEYAALEDKMDALVQFYDIIKQDEYQNNGDLFSTILGIDLKKFSTPQNFDSERLELNKMTDKHLNKIKQQQ